MSSALLRRLDYWSASTPTSCRWILHSGQPTEHGRSVEPWLMAASTSTSCRWILHSWIDLHEKPAPLLWFISVPEGRVPAGRVRDDRVGLWHGSSGCPRDGARANEVHGGNPIAGGSRADENGFKDGRKRTMTDWTTETLAPLLLGIDYSIQYYC
jgi:hypothetical protein